MVVKPVTLILVPTKLVTINKGSSRDTEPKFVGVLSPNNIPSL